MIILNLNLVQLCYAVYHNRTSIPLYVLLKYHYLPKSKGTIRP